MCRDRLNVIVVYYVKLNDLVSWLSEDMKVKTCFFYLVGWYNLVGEVVHQKPSTKDWSKSRVMIDALQDQMDGVPEVGYASFLERPSIDSSTFETSMECSLFILVWTSNQWRWQRFVGYKCGQTLASCCNSALWKGMRPRAWTAWHVGRVQVSKSFQTSGEREPLASKHPFLQGFLEWGAAWIMNLKAGTDQNRSES